MVHIWKIFGDTFGYKWSSQMGDQTEGAIKTWARSLWGQSDEDLLEGARTVVDVWPAGDFPPDLPAFRAYVQMVRDQRLSKERAAGAPMLPAPTGKRERVQSNAAIREMAAMRKMGTPEAELTFERALATVSGHRGW